MEKDVEVVTDKQFVQTVVDDLNRLQPPGIPQLMAVGDHALTIGGCLVGLRPITKQKLYEWWLKTHTTDLRVQCSDYCAVDY